MKLNPKSRLYRLLRSIADRLEEAREDKDSLYSFKPFRILLSITLWCLPIVLISILSPSFSEYYSRTVGSLVRAALAKITGIFPFSVAETILFCCVGYILFTIIYCIVGLLDRREEAIYEIHSNKLVSCALLLSLSLYFVGFAPCNYRYRLEKNLGLERSPLTTQQLYECISIVNNELKECIKSADIRVAQNGSSCLPYSYDELNKRVNECYKKYAQNNKHISNFKSQAKRIALSSLMTHTHISGIYIPYTGEVNININYPDYVVAFTYAHEMAHQRGIAREDEANFTAFAVLYEYGDEYLRYCALTELFNYLSTALASNDPKLCNKALAETPRLVLNEMLGFYEFFEPYSESVASDVAEVLNDTSIKLRGDSNGAESYGLFVELAAAYFDVT